LEIPLG